MIWSFVLTRKDLEVLQETGHWRSKRGAFALHVTALTGHPEGPALLVEIAYAIPEDTPNAQSRR